MRVILVGTNHAHQLVDFDSGAHACFKSYLNSLCQAEEIDLIAEELSEEAISVWGATDSTARSLARTLGVNHIFCDPGSEERAALGIYDYKQLKSKLGLGRGVTSEQDEYLLNEEKKYWPIRERHWLDRILSANAQSCLLIIGASHVEQFCKLIFDNGHECEVRTASWSP